MVNTDSKILIKGPYKKISDQDWEKMGEDVPLYSTRESRSSANAELDVRSIPTQGSESTFLAGFFSGEDMGFSGRTTFQRVWPEKEDELVTTLNNYPELGSDTEIRIETQEEALADYIIWLESLCLEEQGAGFRLEDALRGRSGADAIDPRTGADEQGSNLGDSFLISSVEWEVEEGAPHEINYTLDGFVAEGLSIEPDSRKAYREGEWENSVKTSFFPIDEIKISDKNDADDFEKTDFDRFVLGNVINKRVERSLEMERYQLAYSGGRGNLSIPTSGITQKIAIEGAVTKKDFDEHQSNQGITLEDFSTDIVENWMGNNIDVVYGESMTNRGMNGQISDFSTTWEWGQTRRLKYSLEFVVGHTGGTQRNP